MSMLKAQEYFAPLRSRHISLQQWERGLLFESWGERGLRGMPRRNFHTYMGASDSKTRGEIRGVKRVVPRSVSFSGAFGNEDGPEVRAAKVFRRGLSFPRSFSLNTEIIPEGHAYEQRGSHAADMGRTSGKLLLSPCFERAGGRHMESELENSESSSSRLESRSVSRTESSSEGETDRLPDRSPRLWGKKFFSGGLFFSKDKKIFTGGVAVTRSLGRGPDGVHDWRSKVNRNSGTSVQNGAGDGAGSNGTHEGHLKRNIFARMFSFSRDSREASSSDSGKSSKRGENPRKFFGFRRRLSLDSRGEASSESEFRQIRAACEESDSRKLFKRNWSLSKMLDRRRETLSRARRRSKSCQDSELEDSYSLFSSVRNLSSPSSLGPQGDDEGRLSNTSDSSGSSEISLEGSDQTSPYIAWSRNFISSSGLLSRPTVRRPPPNLKIGGRFPELLESAELRPKKLFGRSLSLPFFTFADSKCRTSSVYNSACPSRSDKVQPESWSRSFFARGFSSYNSRNLGTSSEHSGPPNYGARGSSATFRKPMRFFSRDWSWPPSRSRNHCLSAQLPLSAADSSGPAETSHPSRRSFRAGLIAFSSLRNSRVLKYFLSKRSAGSGQRDQSANVVLLGKVPASGIPETEDLTVFVGERGGNLTKYVLAKRILQHHLFQVLLKCSQDELGSDHDYDSGVPIICDPALFLQVARVVDAGFSPEAQFVGDI